MPLRGELTCPTLSPPARPQSTTPDLPSIQAFLTQFVRLSSSGLAREIPKITISSTRDDAQDATASWSSTASETASTEAALLPLLMHLAAARDDVQGLQFCMATAATWEAEDITPNSIPGGIVNCLEAGTSHSPLHVAALNGNTASVTWLLKSGALVHHRDVLGHTALYYVSASFIMACVLLIWCRRPVEDTRMLWISLWALERTLAVWRLNMLSCR
jgi:60kDa lysophospholipase